MLSNSWINSLSIDVPPQPFPEAFVTSFKVPLGFFSCTVTSIVPPRIRFVDDYTRETAFYMYMLYVNAVKLIICTDFFVQGISVL